MRSRGRSKRHHNGCAQQVVSVSVGWRKGRKSRRVQSEGRDHFGRRSCRRPDDGTSLQRRIEVRFSGELGIDVICNLYRMTKATAEIAKLFRATPNARANLGSEVYPGYPGLVVADGQARSMIWGLPLVLSGKQGQPLKPKPVNNARTDKLSTSFWRDSFEKRRCLIPMTAWAEAEGPKGAMSRTWLSLPGQEVFAAAGIWRPTQEWGEAYAMVMTECCEQTAEVHDRMPVLVSPDHQDEWLSGSWDSAIGLCKPWSGDVAIERTADPWFARRS